MDRKITQHEKRKLAYQFDIELAALEAVIFVESGGKGFDDKTGKILIQFEPHVFKRKNPYTPNGLWTLNKVDKQDKEWEAFDDAASVSGITAAAHATSWGMMQVMGFNHSICGFKSPIELAEYCEVSEHNQVEVGLRFIKASGLALKHIQNKQWAGFAKIYNGAGYAKHAYDVKLGRAYTAAAKKNPPLALLRQGATGPQVNIAQELLGMKNTGVFDKHMHDAVKEYQTTHNMVADGIIGGKTWKTLYLAGH